ncbi:hypothetical protein HHI36_012196 [Cryptolaemus montrouzieri]|uniref:Uncharacterized protein n=1 Tax=Cryptolaemus montrouzieri TaxID=559131 RepID=A0ABD2NDY1_9CUCU
MPRQNNAYRSYGIASLLEASRLVREINYSIYKASKQKGVPWSSLKDLMARNENHPNNQQIVPKLGGPFALTIALERQLFNYIIKMQDLGFGLTVQMQPSTSADPDKWKHLKRTMIGYAESPEKIILKMQRRKMEQGGLNAPTVGGLHVKCQQEDSKEVFMCDTCGEEASDYDED